VDFKLLKSLVSWHCHISRRDGIMTRYFINEREIEAPPDVSSLERILRYIENTHLAPDSVIRKITVDGIPVIPDGKCGLDMTDNPKTVEISTGTITEIARDSIEEALEYLDRIESLTPALSVNFQVSPGSESFENLRQLYEGFYWINLLLEKLAQNFSISLQEVIIKGLPVQEHLNNFVTILKKLIESQEKNDCVLISDLLEYEIIPMVPVWKEIFSFMTEKINSTQTNPQLPVK
jgi:hypothetical protein